jgi:acetylornithine deacetylase
MDMENENNVNHEGESEILQWIDSHKEDTVAFLQELIRIPSVNPWFHPKPEESHEADVQAAIKRRMQALGAEVNTWNLM